MPNDDMALLGDYVHSQSETAFATLVDRNTTKLHIVFPENVSDIPVKRAFEALHVYHCAFSKCPDHTPVWEVVFHYSDGSSATNQLLYDDDVLDWIAKEDGGSVIGPTDPRSRLAWVGGSFSTNRGEPL